MGLKTKKAAQVIEAIVASFRDGSSSSFDRLSSLSSEDWQRTETWLDTSGMSFYFLDRLQAPGRSTAIPNATLRRLEHKFEQNKVRSEDILQEFIAINSSFAYAKVVFANLKGFTLSPASCPDFHLRRQADLDFLVDPAHLDLTRQLLEARGYRVTGENARTLEMKIGITLQIDANGRCKPKHGRSVELHTSLESADPKQRSVIRDERLNRLSRWTYNGEEFPALSPVDQLLGQAVHILSHLRGERTRLSWLLEFRRHVLERSDDADFWDELRSRAAADPEAMIALGLSTMLSSEILGAFPCSGLDTWTMDALTPRIRLWGMHFGRKAVLAEVPGTKLFLLLEDALSGEDAFRSKKIVRRLLPTRPPQRVLEPRPNEGLRLRIHRAIVEFRFIWYRLRFHIKHGLLHLLEARRWKNLLKRDEQEDHGQEVLQRSKPVKTAAINR